MKDGKKHRFGRWLIPLCLTAVVILLSAGISRLPAHAGFGDYNDYSSGSNNDSGSSDYGSGSSDWGSNNDSGYYSSGSSDGAELPGGTIILFIIIIAAVIYFAAKNKKNLQRSDVPGADTSRSLVVEHDSAFDNRTFPDRGAEIETCVRETDPAFSTQDFIAWAKNVYMEIQDAWSKGDLEPVRPILHENLYDQTAAQIEKKKQEGLVNALESIAIGDSRASFLKRDENFEYLTVYMNAKMIDYQYRAETGEVVRGNKVTRWELAYRMRFLRTRGAQTVAADAVQTHTCPKCGAPLDAGATVKCPYCGAVITSSRNNWVLNEFQTVNKNMTDEGIQWKDAKAKTEETSAKETK